MKTRIFQLLKIKSTGLFSKREGGLQARDDCTASSESTATPTFDFMDQVNLLNAFLQLVATRHEIFER